METVELEQTDNLAQMGRRRVFLTQGSGEGFHVLLLKDWLEYNNLTLSKATKVHFPHCCKFTAVMYKAECVFAVNILNAHASEFSEMPGNQRAEARIGCS